MNNKMRSFCRNGMVGNISGFESLTFSKLLCTLKSLTSQWQ